MRLLVRIDHVAALELRRIDDHLGLRRIAEVVDAAALDVLELGRQRALLRPFAVLVELHFADHGLERGLVHVFGELVVVEALGGGDGIAEHLQIGIGPHRHVVAERIGAGSLGARLIFLQQLHRAGELHRLDRQPGLVIDHAVEQRAELGLEHRRLQADHGAAPHLRLEADFVHGVDHADGVERIGADHEQVRIGRLHRAHDRREVGRGRRIALFVDDLEARLHGVLRARPRRHCGRIRRPPSRSRWSAASASALRPP